VNLRLELERLSVQLGRHAVVFEMSLKNPTASFVIRLLRSDFHLWQATDLSANRLQYLAELKLDPRTTVTDPNHQMKLEYKPGDQSLFYAWWFATPDDIQKVEDFRDGKSPVFKIESHFVASKTFLVDGKPQSQSIDWDRPQSGNGWPLMKAIPDVEWLAVLDRLGFKHNTLDRLKWPSMPPAFARAEKHLSDAWRSHRTGDDDGCLTSCYKAFDCLGFDVLKNENGKPEPKEVIKLLVAGAEPDKVKAVDELVRKFRVFCHLGRHDSDAPVKLTHADSQFAVASATTILSYLANGYKAPE
jgi:hypothetical protein